MTDKIQVITHGDLPVAVVVPYDEYQRLVRKAKFRSEPRRYAIPQAVAEMILVKDYTPIKAWRTYLKLSQVEVASKLSMTQAAFSQIETASKNQTTTLKKVATALGIHIKQLQVSIQ